MFSCDDYNPQVFVDRPAAMSEIRQWTDAGTLEKRVISMIAPPGGGKTWMLRNLAEEWNNPGERLVVWMDVPTLIDLSQKQDGNRMIREDEFLEWFRNAHAEAEKRFHIGHINEITEVSAMLSEFVRRICASNPSKAPLILVDGYDELTDAQAEVVGLRLLQPILERECLRLLIAHRPERTIKGDAIRLKVREFLLHQHDPLSLDFAIRQFNLLFQEKYPGDSLPDPTSWMNRLQCYRWNHPLANCFLFNRGITRNWEDLTSQDFYNCCVKVITRPANNGALRFSPLNPEEFRTLHYIASKFDDNWSQDQLEHLLGINNFIMDDTVNKLFNLGLIVMVSGILPLYQICDGLRELLREMDINQVSFAN
jgi:hypothetical protein